MTYSETRNATPMTLSGLLPNGDDIVAFADKAENLVLIATYNFDFGLQPSIGYVQYRQNFQSLGSDYAVKYMAVGAAYNFNKNFSVDAV